MSSLAFYSSLNFGLVAPTPPVNGGADSYMGAFVAPFTGSSGFDIIADGSGNVYVADGGTVPSPLSAVYKILPNGSFSVFAGSDTVRGNVDDTGSAARFDLLNGISYLTTNDLLVYDNNNVKARPITVPGAVVTSWGFNVGASITSGLARLTTAPSGDIYISGGYAIVRMTSAGTGTLIAGPVNQSDSGFTDATGISARFNFIQAIVLDPSTGDIIVADRVNNRIRRVTAAGVVTTIAGSGSGTHSDGSALSAGIPQPYGITITPDGSRIYFTSGHAIKKLEGGVVTTISGNPTSSGWIDDPIGANARFQLPTAISYNLSDNSLYVADQTFTTVRKIT